MSKRNWLILTAAVFILFTATHGLFAGIVAVAVFPGIPYVITCKVSPRTRHGRCNGSGEHRAWWFPWAHRHCKTCHNGRVIRLGARLIGPGYAKREHAAMVTARKNARDRNAWR